MSDEIKKAEMTSEEAFSEEIKRRLAEPDSGKPSLEEFKLMVYKDRERRRKKRNAAVAGIVVALLAGFFAFDTLVPEVGADKNPKEEIITEDGVIIEDGGWGSSVGEENEWVITEWAQVKDAKIIYPQLIVPEHIPPKFSFKKLIIERYVEGDLRSEYLFESTDKNKRFLEVAIIYMEGGETSLYLDGPFEKITCSKGTIYIKETENKATMQIDDGIILEIWYAGDNAELIDIIEHLCD